MRIVADIGGTNARFALYHGNGNKKDRGRLAPSGTLRAISTYPTRGFDDFLSLIRAYMEERALAYDSLTCIAVSIAATVKGNIAKGVNIPWIVDADSIRRAFPSTKVILLNDFEAAAWGVTGLTRKDLLPLGSAMPRADSNLCVLGAGTGLGEAIVVPCPHRHFHIVPTEGGHADFSPTSHLEWTLFNFLKARYGHVSVERVVSGPGISDTYEFLTGKRLRPEDIADLALVEKQDDAMKCIEIFIKNYAKEAGDLALKSLPYGGVYIAGGIALKIRKTFFTCDFKKNFEDKGRMKSILADIPVFICLHQYLGLLGAGIRSDHEPI